MDFFHEQQKARGQTGKLLSLLGLAMICIILAVYFLIRLLHGAGTSSSSSSQPYTPQPMWDLTLLVPVALGVSLILVLGSVFKIVQLRGGGRQIAQSLGGTLIPPDTRDRDERRVLNVVEEMAIASGISPPPVYTLPEKTSINAFAAGFHPENAVIGITEGAIRALTRDQLQGVMAHEFSHILNGDMRLNIRLIGLLHGILLLSIVGEILMRSGAHSRKKESNGIAVIGIGLLIIGHIGVFFGHLIKQAISRQREYLADASAVQFTRNPIGLSGALKKIGGLQGGSRIQHPQAETASHMFFSNGLRRQSQHLGATHPPLKERVKRIEPGFDGRWPVIDPTHLFKLAPEADPKETPEHQPSPFPDLFPDAPIPESVKPVLAGVLITGDADAEKAIHQTGNPQRQHLDAAHALLNQIPEPLHRATRQPKSARLLVFSLLFNRMEDGESKNRLINILISPNEREQFNLLLAAARDVPPGITLPLIELCVVGLRELNAREATQFLSDIEAIIDDDQSIDLFEYALKNMLERSIKHLHEKPPRIPIRLYSVQGIQKECRILLTALAQIGSRSDEDAARAFAAGVRELRLQLSPLLQRPVRLQDVNAALTKMETVAFPVRKQFLQACLSCIMFDGSVRVEEAELYRAMAASLGCPTPLWVIPDSP